MHYLKAYEIEFLLCSILYISSRKEVLYLYGLKNNYHIEFEQLGELCPQSLDKFDHNLV